MRYFVVDAFASEIFKGNPAGVCLLEDQLSNETMQNIAFENNLSETAFVIKKEPGHYDLKWFTPESEIDLCGHATMAAACIIANYVDPGIKLMSFDTLSGLLQVRTNDEYYELDFPSIMPKKIEISKEIKQLSTNISEAYLARDLIIILENQQQVSKYKPDFEKIRKLTVGKGLIITAIGDDCDFVSRCFYPGIGVDEDPVTGSAHANLIPLWAKKLAKKEFIARQLSKRQGDLRCELCNERVKIKGQAIIYLEGKLLI